MGTPLTEGLMLVHNALVGTGLRDKELMDVVSSCEQDTARQLAWLKTRIKQSAPQALIAARG